MPPGPESRIEERELERRWTRLHGGAGGLRCSTGVENAEHNQVDRKKKRQERPEDRERTDHSS